MNGYLHSAPLYKVTMHLSPVYSNKYKWCMVYHTQPDSEEVEIIADKIFDSEKEAWDWFHVNRRIHHYVQPEALRIDMMSMTLSRQE